MNTLIHTPWKYWTYISCQLRLLDWNIWRLNCRLYAIQLLIIFKLRSFFYWSGISFDKRLEISNVFVGLSLSLRIVLDICLRPQQSAFVRWWLRLRWLVTGAVRAGAGSWDRWEAGGDTWCQTSNLATLITVIITLLTLRQYTSEAQWFSHC